MLRYIKNDVLFEEASHVRVSTNKLCHLEVSIRED